MNEIHGHEVIHMMIQSGKLYSKEVLLAEINARFGVQARFYTCSAQNLTAENLVDFLESKGKFVHETGGFKIAAEKVCK